MKRVIQKEVEIGLSWMIVAGEVAEGARVVVDAVDEGIEMRVEGWSEGRDIYLYLCE